MTSDTELESVQQALRLHLNYNSQTGSLRWAIPPNFRIREGDAAGYLTAAGYCYVTIAGYKTTAARVAWYLGTGEWPTRRVICKDGDPTNIRLDNLTMERSKTHMLDIFNKPRWERTIDEWRQIYAFNPDDAETFSDEGQRAKRMLDLFS